MKAILNRPVNDGSILLLACLLLARTLGAGQADQVSNAEKQKNAAVRQSKDAKEKQAKESDGPDLAALLGAKK
jgi:hypothetical protein